MSRTETPRKAAPLVQADWIAPDLDDAIRIPFDALDMPFLWVAEQGAAGAIQRASAALGPIPQPGEEPSAAAMALLSAMIAGMLRQAERERAAAAAEVAWLVAGPEHD